MDKTFAEFNKRNCPYDPIRNQNQTREKTLAIRMPRHRDADHAGGPRFLLSGCSTSKRQLGRRAQAMRRFVSSDPLRRTYKSRGGSCGSATPFAKTLFRSGSRTYDYRKSKPTESRREIWDGSMRPMHSAKRETTAHGARAQEDAESLRRWLWRRRK